MKISNLKIYDLQESIIASGYPMQVEDKETDYLKDTERAIKLAKTEIGTGHNNWLKGVRVSFDLQISQLMLIQLLRYNFIDIVSSQSKMHRITKFDIENNMNEFVTEKSIEYLNFLIQEYNEEQTKENYQRVLYNTPLGFELKMRVSTNYLQLKTIIKQRSEHKLDEWKEFCEYMLNNLPLAKDFLV